MDTIGKYIVEPFVKISVLRIFLLQGCDGGRYQQRISTNCFISIYRFSYSLPMVLYGLDCNGLVGRWLRNRQQGICSLEECRRVGILWSICLCLFILYRYFLFLMNIVHSLMTYKE